MTAFAGVKVNCYEDGGILKLSGLGLFDDIPEFDSVTDLDAFGGSAPSGTYSFFNSKDFGSVLHVRATVKLSVVIVSPNDLIDDRTAPIDEWQDFDGTNAAQCNISIFERHTDDDPAGDPTWTDWQRLDTAEFECRGMQFYALLTAIDPAYNVNVSALGINFASVA